MSPRDEVRVADVDAHGHVLNRYSSTATISGPAPERPWAIHLADAAGRFRLLGFDLDPRAGAAVEEDAARLLELLREAGAGPAVVCRSGPAGGMHVWLALRTPAPAALVAALGRALRGQLVSFDATPLLNPHTGCLRPPGSPHRLAGSSTLVTGDLAALTKPTTTSEHLQALLVLLDASENRADRRSRDHQPKLPRDRAGHRYLPGDRRPLPAAAAMALARPVTATDDASTVLWQVLIGAVRARYRLEDLQRLLHDPAAAPGLEHARSARVGPQRAARSVPEQRQRLAHQWERAVTHVLERAGELGDRDEPGDAQVRLSDVLARVDAAQSRARAAAHRWARPGGATDRRVLDALCLVTLQALSPVIDLDIRRLGEICGISRETARRCLGRLSADGWVQLVTPSHGPDAASWALPPSPAALENTPGGESTAEVQQGVSQAVTRPSGARDRRSAWLRTLAARLDVQAHDVFTPRPGLGQHAGRVYAGLHHGPTPVASLVQQLGYTRERTVQLLERLKVAGLVRHEPGTGWRRTRRSRDRVAGELTVAGTLQRRRRRHALERELWSWWLDELAWMRTPTKTKRRRHDPGPGQQVLALPGLTARRRLGPHPRRRDGRADFRAAAIALGDSSRRSA